MQILLLGWVGDTLVQADVFRTIPGESPDKSARAIMRKLWSAGRQPDVCRIYQVKGTSLILERSIKNEN